MKQHSIVLFSESAQFLNVTKKTLEAYNINIQKCINNLNEINKIADKKSNIFVVQLPYKNKEKSENIISIFQQNKLNWICVGENSTINFFAMTKGAMGNIILKQTPTSIEYKVFIKNLISKINQSIEIASIINSRCKKQLINKAFDKIVAIGASTGGTEAIQHILTNLTENIPPTVIVIHMPPGFTKLYASRLNDICKMYVKEAEDGDILKYGVVYIAPGGYHMRVLKRGKELYLSCIEENKVNGHMPSVDVLFESIAQKLLSVVMILEVAMLKLFIWISLR